VQWLCSNTHKLCKKADNLSALFTSRSLVWVPLEWELRKRRSDETGPFVTPQDKIAAFLRGVEAKPKPNATVRVITSDEKLAMEATRLKIMVDLKPQKQAPKAAPEKPKCFLSNFCSQRK